MGNKSTKLSETQTKTQLSTSFDIPSEDLEILKTLGFGITDRIGSGEYGSVYRGMYGLIASGLRDYDKQLLDIRFGQQFALKYIDIKELEEYELRQGLTDRNIRLIVENEKQIRRKILNSNIVQIKHCISLGFCRHICVNQNRNRSLAMEDITVCPSYDRIYLFMDFADFGNLDKYLSDLRAIGKRVSEPNARNWFKQLVSSLRYLHERQVIHRNIKPNNVLLFTQFDEMTGNQSICAKLSDFGFNDNYCKDLSNDSESDVSDNSSDEDDLKLVKYSRKQLDQMTDIYLLSNIFELIVENANFDSKTNRDLALDLIQSIRDFSFKQCIDVLKHQLFQTLS